jgi:hypothetical protein
MLAAENCAIGASALARREPIGEVQDDARKEPRFGGAQQKAEGVEAARPGCEHHRHRHEPPHDGDPGDPDARADSCQRQIAGHFEEKVAKKENAGAATVLERRKAERRVHLQGGEADVDAIEIGDEIEQREERNQAADAANGARADVGGRQLRQLFHRTIMSGVSNERFQAGAFGFRGHF